MIYIKQIKIRDFKNFVKEQTFIFDKNINIITGKNGLGKTSILDAIVWVLKGRLLSGAQDGWKPKELYTDLEGNKTSKVKDIFNTLVEVTLGFDNNQKDIIIKRTSCCGKSTVVYYNGITDTQKQINKYLDDALGFDTSKFLIYTNPEKLFNPDEISQMECGKLIFDSVRNTVTKELQNLYDHLFDNYQLIVDYLEDETLEKSLAVKLLNDTKKKLSKNVSENEIIEQLEDNIESNLLAKSSKQETIKYQENILKDYHLKLKQEEEFKKLELTLDKAEQQLRNKLFEKNQLLSELRKLENSYQELVTWLHDFELLLQTNPSNNDIKAAFGIKTNGPISSQAAKINALSITTQRIKCPVCGNWYVPKETQGEEFNKKFAAFKKELENKAAKPQETIKEEIFDYIPKLTERKEQIKDSKNEIDKIKDKIVLIDKQINLFEYQSLAQLQQERNLVSKFFAGLDTGKETQKQVNNLSNDVEECNINIRYMNILLNNIKEYQKKKLNIITTKLNDNLSAGIISLYKLQSNGTIKDCVTIIDKYSSAAYAETNQSNRIKLGIEVCKILQDFNNINIPIFIDEIGRFNNYDFIKDLGHQIIATLPVSEEQLKITH